VLAAARARARRALAIIVAGRSPGELLPFDGELALGEAHAILSAKMAFRARLVGVAESASALAAAGRVRFDAAWAVHLVLRVLGRRAGETATLLARTLSFSVPRTRRIAHLCPRPGS